MWYHVGGGVGPGRVIAGMTRKYVEFEEKKKKTCSSSKRIRKFNNFPFSTE